MGSSKTGGVGSTSKWCFMSRNVFSTRTISVRKTLILRRISFILLLELLDSSFSPHTRFGWRGKARV